MNAPLLALKVKGFCSLIDASLELQPGVTIIRGVSNEGKSSLIKALYQLLYNPSGRGFVNQSTQVCDITLFFNGHTVEYHKTSTSSTKYTIDGKVFDKVVGPLPQISELLNFSQGELITSDKVNFWSQMSLPFLLYDSPKDRYEIISSGIYNLEDVRDLMVQDNKSLSKSIDDTNTKLGLLQKDVDKLKSQIFEDQHLRELTDKFFATSQTFNNFQSMITVHLNLTNQFNQVEQKLSSLNLDSLFTQRDALTSLHAQYAQLLQQVRTYLDLTSRISNLDVSLNNVNKQLSNATSLLTQFKVCPLCHNPINNCTEIHN